MEEPAPVNPVGARPGNRVLEGAAGLLPAFVAAGRELVNQGAEAITTHCGYLSLSGRFSMPPVFGGME
ncbi:MAG: hypothetical protein ABIP08_07000, partial [Lautropia sp.]